MRRCDDPAQRNFEIEWDGHQPATSDSVPRYLMLPGAHAQGYRLTTEDVRYRPEADIGQRLN